MNSSKAAIRADRGPMMAAHRTASIDSTVSSISSSTTASQQQQRANGNNAYRVSAESVGPQDPHSAIAAAGSAELAVQKLLQEKQQAASHNAQLWRLVEKQRSMILGLNKDLEKALKEKERYRRKLKDQLAQSSSAPALLDTGDRNAPHSNNASPSSSNPDVPPPNTLRDISVDTRKANDSADTRIASAGRSDTPQDPAILSSSGLPTTPQSASSLSTSSRELDRSNAAAASAQAKAEHRVAEIHHRAPTRHTPPVSPRLASLSQQAAHSHHKQHSSSSLQTSPPPSAQSFSSPKTRKAPPAPLRLESARSDPNFVNNIVDASDSDYEDDPESARSEYMERGRRKTREDDDRERDLVVQQEEEQRSRSKKDKKSKSRPSADAEIRQAAQLDVRAPQSTQDAPRQQPVFQATTNPADIIRNRAKSDATGMLPRSTTAPSLMSPGLPMSPRPGDRPPNSPMPRALNAQPKSIPMSPTAGFPLSPRAPRQPIPLPPQTPLIVTSPHLDRAKAYHQQSQPQTQPLSNLVDRLRPSPDAISDYERPSTSPSSLPASTPGEVYKGLTDPAYPDQLLPPSALSHVYVTTASSRMLPSRASYIAPKQADENPVFTMAVHLRSDRRQLWRVEKTFAALASFDQQIKSLCQLRGLPDKQLFAGHAPSKIDARRMALNQYFEQVLDSAGNEKVAAVVCKFLSKDPFTGEGSDYFGTKISVGRPDSPVGKLRPNRAGYLTKRGKNFGGWKARYFVLDGPNLKYFEGPGGAHLGSIKLQKAQIGKQSPNNNASPDDEENQFRHAFLILEPKKKDSSALVRHVLCAESDDERDAWVGALLQYVDFQDDEDQQPARQAQVSKTEITGHRSPRLQKSMSDLRPSSNTSRITMQSTTSASAQSVQSAQSFQSAPSLPSDEVRTIGYNETVAGEAPLMYPPGSQTPSPPYEQLTADQSQAVHPAISGPTNLQVIQNTGDWGMRPPPIPGAKDKKRSMFSSLPFGRGRSSSDLAPGDIKAANASTGSRGVFGVPLAEAVAAVPVEDAETDLPAVVYRCVEYLIGKHAVAEEGIFRLSGSNTVIRSLKDRFNTEGDVNLMADEHSYDVHAVASLLKLYLRELPASILTRDLHLDFLHCLETVGEEKIFQLNELVRRLPAQNRALLEALSDLMMRIVDKVELNKMNVRNLGVVFSPTLNLPGPLISLFVEEQRRIFGPALQSRQQPVSTQELEAKPASSADLRSPRKQMFSDLPTPAYNQTQFQSGEVDDTGMTPMQPTYANYQMAPQGEGGFASLNDALRSPTVYGMTGTGAPTPREIKSRRRESGMLGIHMGMQKKSSASRLRQEQGTSF
ncbi:putative Rho-type GTPase-activating protein 2 [Fulvia fulva]|uniref:Rho-type GTPase-activating protein 2 n=1 Tax=Passalora fulva TaxID=5499 RepID=A0A9Q8PI97_PASFU|nr:putative Rho-type GTPase-activating protein 2 [Fulvia fulva]KAK4615621.1 putative Rho-type GTPase-activating protein 2 [Fulvia fulva]KAK4616563.1 putative Rho-type GTPase-activating protein 2 [Fulvia fulva]UJO22927.1 putative Rho-type GTPase-activating protein 2 [Fulvia fulva]WPV19134.1 putative Rho-type GTPase-activating protein 2 [Fulvia fulva]WPV34322.1 putative Rho-type GTPase-activating protein 2 [Fulvia fulva]